MPLSREYKDELKVKAAYYYYKKNMKLSDIADSLKVSRVTLNKLLKDAVEEGIVRIEIIDKNNSLSLLDLEESVKKRFSLKDVKIVDPVPNDPSYAANEIALTAAKMVDSMMFSGMKISLTWGRTLELLVNYLKGDSYIKDIEVFTLLGASGIIGLQMQPNTIAHSLLRKYSGIGFVMNAPFMCETVEAAKTIMSDKTFTSIVEASMDSDLTLVGIGPTPNELTSQEKRRYDLEIVKELKNYNVCGDICSNFYDIYGNLCTAPLCERFVRVGLDNIKKHKCVMGIAGGDHKVASILGALNGAYLDILITDKDTIVSVMEMADRLGV